MAITDFAIELTEGIASYMKAKFLHKLRVHKGDGPPVPSEWDFSLIQECDQAVDILLEAYHNSCRVT